MKNYTLLLGLLLGWMATPPNALQAQPDYTLQSAYRLLTEGAEALIWRDQVPIYQAPSTQAPIGGTAPASSRVTVRARLDEQERRAGFRTNWYAVEYHGAEGYVWGGDLAVQAQPFDAQTWALLGVQRLELVNRGTYDEEQIVLQLTIVQQGRPVAAATFPAVGTLYTQVQLHTQTDHQLTGIQQILEVQYSDGYCGGVSATQTLLWDGTTLHPLEVLSNGFSDTQFDRSYYRYPNEHRYGKDIVVLQQEAGTYNAQNRPQYTHQVEQQYRWTGKELQPIQR